MKLLIAAIIFSVVLITRAVNNEPSVPCAGAGDPFNKECRK